MLVSRTFLSLAIALTFTGVFSAIQYKKCAKGWAEKGCKIGYHYNLTVLEDDRFPTSAVKIDWNNLEGYLHDLKCRCREKATKKSYKFFALYKEGICLGAPGELADFLRLHPLETDVRRCTGKISIGIKLSDGSQCVPGIYRAFFYSIEKPVASNPQGNEEESEKEAAANPGNKGEEEVASCKDVADVFLVMDVSGSIGNDGFKIQQNFAVDFFRRFDLSKSRVAILTYDHKVTSVLSWKKSSTMTLQNLIDYVNKIEYSAGYTDTGLALHSALTRIVVPDQRKDVHITGIVMTDGKSFDAKYKLEEEATKLKDDYKVRMVAIGIGRYDKVQLEKIVSDEKEDNLLLFDTFKQLDNNMGSLLNKLVKKACL